MNPINHRAAVRRGSCLVLCSLLVVTVVTVARAAETPPPLSNTRTGVFIGHGADDGVHFLDPLHAYETWFKNGETNWSKEPIGSLLVFGDMLSWKRMMGNLGWLKAGSRWGGADRPLVWSLPLFPWAVNANDNWLAATSSMTELRFEAEAAALESNATVISHSEASAVDGANQDANNAVSIPTNWGAVRFANLSLPQAVNHVRVSFRATAAGSMDVMINGNHVKTVSFPSTLYHGWQSPSTPAYVFQELRITGITLAPGDTLKLYSNANSAFQVDYVAFGNYDEWYRRAANILKDFRPADPVIFVRPGWEFTGDWYPWAAGGHEADFATAFQRFVTAFRAVSPRFRFDWCAAFIEEFTSSRPNPESCYPGGAYVDIVGLDLYDSEKWDGDLNGDGNYAGEELLRWNHYETQGCGLGWVREFAAAHGKLVGIAEWGVSGDNRDANGTLNETVANNNPDFVHWMHRWLGENRAIYHHYWESNAGYRGRLSDGDPADTANAYLFDFSMPLKLDSGADAPPYNTSDEFDRSIPRAQWTVGNPNHANWSLTAKPGRLRLTSNGTHFSGSTAANVVLQAAPDDDFQIVTRVYGKPGGSGQVAGLLVYGDNNHYVRMARQNGGTNVFVFGTEVNDVLAETQVADGVGTLAYLKIARVGSNYTGYYSANGVTWTQVGGTRTLSSTNPRLALVAYGPAGFAAEFDTFFVNKLEAEHARPHGVQTASSTAVSGERAVGWFDANGDAIEWKNVAGGSSLQIRYASPYSGTKGLYVDGVRVQSIAFAATGGNGAYQNMVVNRRIPPGSTLKLQHDAGDTAWNVDYVAFTHEAKFEAEEAETEGVTEGDGAVGSSNDGAVRIRSDAWGAVKFTQLHATTAVTLRYRCTSGGTIQYSVNGGAAQNLVLPASAGFRDVDLAVTVPAGGSIKFSKNNAVSFSVDYIAVR